ncbi:MAG: hypothetical protein GY847_40350 [Proteobacteria bacterium]|nr:hypothetical protein [Pseudomonadota bacterium]
MKIATILTVLGVSVLALGCLPDTSGIDPPSDKLVYPVGLAVTPEIELTPKILADCNPDAGDLSECPQRYLLAANSNFDLKYNSGTLVAIDLNKLDEIESNLNSDKPKSEYLEYLSEDNKYLFVPEDELIKSEETIRIGSFASDLDLTPNGKRALIPVRGKRAILIIDLGSEANGILSCGNKDDGRECNSKHRIERNDDLNITLPIEPYEVASLEYVSQTGKKRTTKTLGFATHLYRGEVSLFVIDTKSETIDDREVPEKTELTLTPELIDVVGGVVPGASGIAVNPNRREIYVSGRHDPVPHVAVMKVLTDSEHGSFTSNPYFNDVGGINIAQDLYGGTDARGLAVTESGDTAFLVTRTPEALLQLDTADRKLTGMTTLGADPSVVALYENDYDNLDPSDDTANVNAFVLCFLRDQVYIVESDNMLSPPIVRTTGFGPHAIAFDKARQRAYIANFTESTITVLNAEWPFDHVSVPVPGSDSRAKIKIGKPRMPESHN